MPRTDAAAKHDAAQSPAPAAEAVAHSLSIRIDLAGGARIGPGKIALLEAIAREGSISGAGRALKMSYRRAWELVEQLNLGLGAPVVSTAAGGANGGGARLTAVGTAVVEHYRAIEAAAATAARPHVAAIGGIGTGRTAE
ncbi:MAG: LysR family transcriptional regulator [Proteobacteria bacterium]|nr:LysR family transcriptional regulator [Pseudomonadota bacterium]